MFFVVDILLCHLGPDLPHYRGQTGVFSPDAWEGEQEHRPHRAQCATVAVTSTGGQCRLLL